MLLRFIGPAAAVLSAASIVAGAYVNQTTCNGKTYSYNALAGYGFVPSNARDMYGDTLGGLGSSLALDTKAWKKLEDGSYTGILWTLPDRGWNTQGTLNFQPRIHKFKIAFTPKPSASIANPSAANLLFEYQTTVLLSGPDGLPCTGLDADGSGSLSYENYPPLPAATFTGDGFGGAGDGGKLVALDPEGLVLNEDGSFWISDEYGPYIYRFNQAGKMVQAIRPIEAIIPKRNGSDSFSANSPPHYINNGEGDDVIPAETPTGRNNNHGFEGLTVSRDGKCLYVLLQAATNQEGGLEKQTERYARLLKYEVKENFRCSYVAEYVVPLPLYVDPTAKPAKNPKVASQSEIFHLKDGQFLVLSRDSGAGHGADSSLSVYRQVDVFNIENATNIKGSTYDCASCSIASAKGVLKSGITPAQYCPFLDFNVNTQLNRFGVQNGGAQDSTLLNEKWESLGLVPVDGKDGKDGEYFLLSLSDNDFITQQGFSNFAEFAYQDGSGYNLDSQALIFKITLPKGVKI